MKKNLLLKILVILLAFLFWILQSLWKDHKSTVELPVNFSNLSEDLIVLNEQIPRITLQFEARGLDFTVFHLSEPHIEVDGSDFDYGLNEYQVTPADLRNLGRAKLDMSEFNPLITYNIEIDKIIERNIPLRIRYASASDEEFFLNNKIANPGRKIQVNGPKSILDQLQYIETLPINQKMLKDASVAAVLNLPDPRLIVVKNEVSLEVTEAKQINKIISLIPISYPLELGISIIPQKISVMILGPQEIVEEVERTSIQAFINQNRIENLKAGESTFVPVEFKVPAGVKLVEYTPQQIQVIKND